MTTKLKRNTSSKIRVNFKSFRQMKQVLDTNDKCILYLEELLWDGAPVSPFDADSKVYKCKKHRYKCRNTGKYFNILTGTIFENTKLPLILWFELIYNEISHRNGMSSTTAADLLEVTQNTAFNMLHKIRNVMGKENYQQLSGIVEISNYLKSSVSQNQYYDKSTTTERIFLQGMVERGGNTVITVLSDMDTDTLCACILKHVKPGSILCTGENSNYKGITNFYKSTSASCYTSKNQKCYVHTNTTKNMQVMLTRTLKTYIQVSGKFLQSYANECVFRYNTRKMKHIDAFIWFLQNIASTKITGKEIRLGHC